jgi:hypothetical protein
MPKTGTVFSTVLWPWSANESIDILLSELSLQEYPKRIGLTQRVKP